MPGKYLAMVHVIDLEFSNVPNSIASFLVDSEGGPILIETGPYSRFEKLEAGIRKCGYELDDIKHVFLTHIHLDHAGAAWAFAERGATIYLHPFGQRHIQNPERLISSARRIYLDQMETLWGIMKPIAEDRIRVVGHGEDIQIGDLHIKGWHTPGHAVHHIAWQIGNEVFTGDVAGVRIGDGIPVPPCPPPDINIEDWQQSISLLHSLKPKALYLTHFGKVLRTGAHLNELEKRILNWANWMRPFAEKQMKIEDIIPQFQEFVNKDLADGGVSPEGLLTYEAVSPSWMSVAGLFRYWQKKLEPAH